MAAVMGIMTACGVQGDGDASEAVDKLAGDGGQASADEKSAQEGLYVRVYQRPVHQVVGLRPCQMGAEHIPCAARFDDRWVVDSDDEKSAQEAEGTSEEGQESAGMARGDDGAATQDGTGQQAQEAESALPEYLRGCYKLF